MPRYDTPEPIAVTLELGVGDVRITASDRADTVVEIRPSDDTDESDVQAARQIQVDYTDGTLRITSPKRVFDFSRKTRSADVSIDLPTGSPVSAQLIMGEIHCAGQLGPCRLKTTGHVRVDRTGPLNLHTGAGSATADTITGDAEISTGTGEIRIGEIHGAAVVKNSNGDTTIDSVDGDVRIRNANGDIHIDRAGAGVDAKTSNGSIRLGQVVHGSVQLGTAAGNLDIGIADGTAAWLEVKTGFGHVRNLLENTTRPDQTDETVEIRGHTSYGDITIHHS